MKVRFRAWLCALLALLLLMGAMLPALADDAFIPLKKGKKGDVVVPMKERLFELGYLVNVKPRKEFDTPTERALKKFQRLNGLEETGILDAETNARLHASEAICAFPQLETPIPLPQIAWPERDADGYLAADGEFVHEDDEGGFWAYLTRDLQITIMRCADESIPLEWFETDIRMRNAERFRTVENNPDRPGTKFRYPFDIATDNGFVLGFTDDFYGDRIAGKKKIGIVIREGEVLSSSTYKKRMHTLPNLDMMAQYPDGRLICYRVGEISADELVAQGAQNVYCFGPVLIKDGEWDPMVMEGWFETKSPRQALAMYEPGHYLLLSVQGRMDTSEGAGLIRMARMLKARGVQEAFNLDGGNTMALIFRGRMLNKLATYEKRTFVRTVSSLIGVGQMEYPQADE